MRKEYIESLSALNKSFLDMLKESRVALQNAIQSLKDKKLVENYNFKNLNKKFQLWEEETEKKIFRLIALQGPVSSDLRLMLGILKSTNDVKRVVNTSQRIAKVIKRYSTHENISFNPDVVVLETFNEMGIILLKMLDEIITVFETGEKLSHERAIEIQQRLIREDDDVDSLFKDTIKKLIKIIQEQIDSKKQAKLIADSLLMARHMERIGDHLCNIAERILYIETGDYFHIY